MADILPEKNSIINIISSEGIGSLSQLLQKINSYYNKINPPVYSFTIINNNLVTASNTLHGNLGVQFTPNDGGNLPKPLFVNRKYVISENSPTSQIQLIDRFGYPIRIDETQQFKMYIHDIRRTFSELDVSGNYIYMESHPFVNNDIVRIYTTDVPVESSNMPCGLSYYTNYTIYNADNTKFQLKNGAGSVVTLSSASGIGMIIKNSELISLQKINSGTLKVKDKQFENGTKVIVKSNIALPFGFSEKKIYYVVNANGNYINLSETLNGSPIYIKSDGIANHYIQEYISDEEKENVKIKYGVQIQELEQYIDIISEKISNLKKQII